MSPLIPINAHAEKKKLDFLVFLPTPPNHDKELHKEAVLSAHEHAESRILLFAAMSGDYCSVFTWCERGGMGLLTAKRKDS